MKFKIARQRVFHGLQGSGIHILVQPLWQIQLSGLVLVCLGDKIWRWLLTLDINLDWPVIGLRDAAFADWCAVDGLLCPQLDRSATLAICDGAPAQHLEVDAAQAASNWSFHWLVEIRLRRHIQILRDIH